ncbi:MAG: UDP-N-acetylmuramate--L-alanine ligase [Bacteroidales bacterium]|nr:UDP-N-acetylmuramate--L-alanine ligase [Bacteroidales bacterium]
MSEINFAKYRQIYFLGIGGIGMSALARFFNTQNYSIAGYDKVRTTLCEQLENEGMHIHYNDDVSLIPPQFLRADDTLVVYTPAIPKDHTEWNYLQEQQFTILKRAQVLGLISKHYQTIAVAGTHGKTTISTMTTHLLNSSSLKANGFLGGISKNYHSNMVLSSESKMVVTEADEFDRSFLNLFPNMALISSMDADHLDIYGEHEALQASFVSFVDQIHEQGTLVYKKGLPMPEKRSIQYYTYAIDNPEADFYASHIQLQNELYQFDLESPLGRFENLILGIPGIVNLENAIGASALAVLNGVKAHELREGLKTYQGVLRRFDYQIRTPKLVYIDDYAHHPEELKAFISSVRKIYPTRKLTGIFQPHLYSRTKDFAEGFAQSLSLLDQVFLMDIYPARELPIPGVSSEMIFKDIKIDDKHLTSKANLLELLKNHKFDVLLTMGAGDIDTFVKPLKTWLESK